MKHGYLTFEKVTELFGLVARLKQEKVILSILFHAACPYGLLSRVPRLMYYVLSPPLSERYNIQTLHGIQTYSLVLIYIIKIYY